MLNRILLIDDDKDDAEMFSDALTDVSPGTNFDYFTDGITALKVLERTDLSYPDLIFLDINMPLLDGWQCLRKIKEIAALAHIPIVMYSTSNMEGRGANPDDVGAAAFMTKPDTYQDLRIQLGNILQKF